MFDSLVFVGLFAGQFLLDPAVDARLKLRLRDQVRDLQRRAIERIDLAIKQGSFHGNQFANVATGWQKDRLTHQFACEQADELLGGIVTKHLFKLRGSVCVLGDLLDELFEPLEVHPHLAHFESPECLVEILWLEGALIFDHCLAEKLDA